MTSLKDIKLKNQSLALVFSSKCWHLASAEQKDESRQGETHWGLKSVKSGSIQRVFLPNMQIECGHSASPDTWFEVFGTILKAQFPFTVSTLFQKPLLRWHLHLFCPSRVSCFWLLSPRHRNQLIISTEGAFLTFFAFDTHVIVTIDWTFYFSGCRAKPILTTNFWQNFHGQKNRWNLAGN